MAVTASRILAHVTSSKFVGSFGLSKRNTVYQKTIRQTQSINILRIKKILNFVDQSSIQPKGLTIVSKNAIRIWKECH